MLVTDVLCRTIEILAPPRRIVSLIPSVTETLFALGLDAEVVGVTNFCIYPKEKVRTRTRIGGPKRVDLSCLLSLSPDLVIANVEENLADDVRGMEEAGIPVYVCFPRTVLGSISLVRELGNITCRQETAEEIATQLDRLRTAAMAARAGKHPLRVFFAVWKNPYMSVGPDTYISDLLTTCGGTNVFCHRQERYFTTSLEEIALLSPDVIILPTEPYRFLQEDIAEFTAISAIPAVRTGRVHIVPGESAVWFGRRTAEGLRLISSIFWPGELTGAE